MRSKTPAKQKVAGSWRCFFCNNWFFCTVVCESVFYCRSQEATTTTIVFFMSYRDELATTTKFFTLHHKGESGYNKNLNIAREASASCKGIMTTQQSNVMCCISRSNDIDTFFVVSRGRATRCHSHMHTVDHEKRRRRWACFLCCIAMSERLGQQFLHFSAREQVMTEICTHPERVSVHPEDKSQPSQKCEGQLRKYGDDGHHTTIKYYVCCQLQWSRQQAQFITSYCKKRWGW